MHESRSLTETDRRVLGYLREAGADYPALVAGNTGTHIPLVERRIATLGEWGYVEAVTDEAIYRITEAGVTALDGAESEARTRGSRSTLDGE